MTTETLTTGTQWTCPDGVYAIQIECWGGGGRGSTLTSSLGGGGGGGGAYARVNTFITVPGQTYNYAIGQGSTTTAAGTDTSFNSTTCVAKGGNSAADNSTTGAAGGLASASTGDAKNDGGAGANGTTGTNGGGGGEAGSTSGTGHSGSGSSGGTGYSDAGDGGAGKTSPQGGGTAGSAPGGGGGGALRTSSGTRTGGSGANGQITLTYTKGPRIKFLADQDGQSSGHLPLRELVGFSSVAALSAALITASPPASEAVPVPAEYQTGTHEQFVKDSVRSQSSVWSYTFRAPDQPKITFVATVAEIPQPNTSQVTPSPVVWLTPTPIRPIFGNDPQPPPQDPGRIWEAYQFPAGAAPPLRPLFSNAAEWPIVAPSKTWGAGLADTTVDWTIINDVVGEQEEPRYQPSSFWQQAPTAAPVTTPAVPFAGTKQEWPRQAPSSTIQGPGAQLIPPPTRPIFSNRPQIEPQPQLSSDIWGTLAVEPPVIRQILGQSQEFRPDPPSKVWTTFQTGVIVVKIEGSFVGSSAEVPQFGPSYVWISPAKWLEQPIIRVALSTSAEIPLAAPSSTWSQIPPSAGPAENPPLRPAIYTEAEVPRQVPSSVWGEPSLFAPPQPGDTGAEYHYGRQGILYDVSRYSIVWKAGQIQSVAPTSPPNRPLWLDQPDGKAVLDKQNGSVFWNTVIIGVRVSFVAQEVVGDFDPPPYQVSSLWYAQPPSGAAPVSPPNRPTVATRQEVGPYASRNDSTVWVTVKGIVTDLTVIADVVGDFDEPPYQPSGVWGHKLPPPPPPEAPPNRPLIQTIQELGPYVTRNYSNQWGRPWLPSVVVENPPLRPTVFSVPQPDIQLRPSDVWGTTPPTAVRPPKFSFIVTYPTERYFLEPDRSNVSSIKGYWKIPPVLLTGIQVSIYQGTLTPEVQKSVSRVITQPKYLEATEELTPPFNFASALESGETITGATVGATVYSGTDANPSNILLGSPTIQGASVRQIMTGGIVGVIYDLKCTATTSLGQILIQNTYFYVEPDLP